MKRPTHPLHDLYYSHRGLQKLNMHSRPSVFIVSIASPNHKVPSLYNPIYACNLRKPSAHGHMRLPTAQRCTRLQRPAAQHRIARGQKRTARRLRRPTVFIRRWVEDAAILYCPCDMLKKKTAQFIDVYKSGCVEHYFHMNSKVFISLCSGMRFIQYFVHYFL